MNTNKISYLYISYNFNYPLYNNNTNNTQSYQAPNPDVILNTICVGANNNNFLANTNDFNENKEQNNSSNLKFEEVRNKAESHRSITEVKNQIGNVILIQNLNK